MDILKIKYLFIFFFYDYLDKIASADELHCRKCGKEFIT
jgi:hypothetical protein